MRESIPVNGQAYALLRLLGRGKGGYSYLAEKDGRTVVLKQIHHEPCAYYAFGNKIEAEQRDWGRLRAAGIRIPALIDIDIAAERIVKEYIEGPTVFDLVRDGVSVSPYLPQAREMAEQARAAGLNIDYFPTNFVVRDGLIYYVDYECNAYMDAWSFENWGIQYWSRTPAFEKYLEENGMQEVSIQEERVSAAEYIEFLKTTDLGMQYPRERFEERIEKLVANASISLIARNREGVIVGALFALTDYAYWLYVTDLGVARAYEKQGIGKRLMQTAHRLAGGEKDIAVYLIANENAVPFYEKLGMKKADDVMQYNHIEWTEFTVS